MTSDQAERLADATPLLLVGKRLVEEDGSIDVAPSRCYLGDQDMPHWGPPPEGELRISCGGMIVTWPIERLHLTWEEAIADTLSMLRDARVTLNRAFADLMVLRDQGEPAEEDE